MNFKTLVSLTFEGLLIVGLFVGGYLFGQGVTMRQERVGEERGSRILAFIVERNPDATIKDFNDFPKILLEESERAGIDYRLILAIADKESRLNPKAVGASGEIGLLQLMPGTALIMAKALNLEGYEPPKGKNLGSLADPKVNLRLGIAYFKDQLDKFDRIDTALRAYNRPPQKALEHRPGDRYAEDITIAYADLVRKLP